MIIENLNRVNNNIEEACKRSNRPLDNVTLIAVSKTHPAALIEEVYQQGVKDFGENKVQELIDKFELLPKDIRWHMIGHLQRNKVKYIVGKVFLIHSVDSVRLAEEISKEALKKQVIADILIEVNIANENSKFGVTSREDTLSLIKEIAALPGIRIKGLMCVAPYVDISEENRPYFVNLRQLAVDIEKENIDNVTIEYLSMGMSGDYEIAIEEGANFVRVGTGIFGEREYVAK